MDMHGNNTPPPTSPTCIFLFILHSCQSFRILCINITFPQRRHVFTLNSTDQKSINVTAIHPSLSWDWGPTVTRAVQTHGETQSVYHSKETQQTKESKGDLILSAYCQPCCTMVGQCLQLDFGDSTEDSPAGDWISKTILF